MPFKAASPVPCIRCHATIAQGEPISWTRGKGAQPGVYHVACPGACPPAVSFDEPHLNTPTLDALPPVADYTDDEPLPDEPAEPVPGTREWFATATMADREYQLTLEVAAAYTRREFVRAVARYSKRLTEKETARLRRYARGLWDGRVAQLPQYADTDGQLSLFPTPSAADQHSAETATWRALTTAWETVPA